MSRRWDDRTYRIRQLPLHVSLESLPGFLIDIDRDLGPLSNITIWSLADELGLSDDATSKIATVTFQYTPQLLNDDSHEWKIEIRNLNPRLKERHGLNRNILFDTHFLGCTPLNNVDKDLHDFE